MYKRVYTLQQGLTLHYHHSKNLFCNPSPQYRTLVEESVNFDLPPRVEANLTDNLGSETGSFPDIEYDELLQAVWLNSESGGDLTVGEDAPADVPIPTNVVPPINQWAKGFELSYTDAQFVETKL
jgi:hypothetical protein